MVMLWSFYIQEDEDYGYSSLDTALRAANDYISDFGAGVALHLYNRM